MSYQSIRFSKTVPLPGTLLTPTTDFVPCSGTPTLATSPNNMNDASWTPFNCTRVNNAAVAPDSTTTASSLTLTGAGNTGVFTNPNRTLTGGVIYSLEGYFKNSVAAGFVLFGISDNVANAFQVSFDITSGLVVGNSLAGDGSISCSKITSVGNGWFRVSVAGFYAATNTLAKISILPQQSDAAGHVGDEIFSWQICP